MIYWISLVLVLAGGYLIWSSGGNIGNMTPLKVGVYVICFVIGGLIAYAVRTIKR
jgi:hypothetical protein